METYIYYEIDLKPTNHRNVLLHRIEFFFPKTLTTQLRLDIVPYEMPSGSQAFFFCVDCVHIRSGSRP